MSNLAIDQLFQIAVPTRSGREFSQPGPGDGDLFRSHLDRAAEVSEPKPTSTKTEKKSTAIDEDEPLEPQSGQQETSTAEQDQATVVSETSEKPAGTEKDAPSEEATTDEVTLSAAAAQQSETEVVSEQAVSTEGIVETSFADGQQPSDEQTTTPTTETQTESTGPSTETQAVELETDLLEGVAGEATRDEGEVNETVQAKTLSSGTEIQREAIQTATATVVEGEVKKAQTSAVSTNVRLPSGKKQSANEALETLLEAGASESSSKVSQGRFEVPVATANDLAVAADTKLGLTSLNTGTETAVDVPNSSASTSNSETITAAGRTLGTLLAGKTASSTNATAETSTTEAPTVNRARFVHRVSGAIRSAQLREGQIQLRLSPPELGTLRINIVMTEGVLTAHLETETTAARTVLLDNLPALRERLAEQEIRIDKFDVDVGREGQQQTDDPETNDRQPNNARSQVNPSANREQGIGVTATESDTIQNATASGLDVRI